MMLSKMLVYWILFMSTLMLIQMGTMARKGPPTCSIGDLKPGLKYDGNKLGLWSVTLQELIKVRCYDIYVDKASEVQCVGPAWWTDPNPECTPKKCEIPTMIENSHLVMGGLKVGNTLTIDCIDGYWYDGSKVQICQNNTKWSGHVGQCKPVKCPELSAPAHGSIRFKSFRAGKYGFNSTVMLSCDPDFVYNGPRILNCLNNNTWNGTLGTCKEKSSITCKPLEPAENMVIHPTLEEARYNDKITITCHRGYIYNGTAIRVCQVDDTWSGKPGTCNVVTCQAIEDEMDKNNAWTGVDYMKVKITHSFVAKFSNHPKSTSSSPQYGDTAEVMCPAGYWYTGSVLICDEEGKWNGKAGSCQAIPCEEDPTITNGTLNGEGFVFNDTTSVSCDQGFVWEGSQPHAQCQKDGSWRVNGQCKAVVCTDNPIINGDLQSSWYVYTNKALVNCHSKYTWEGTTPHAECTSDGTWKVNGQCIEMSSIDVILGTSIPVSALSLIILICAFCFIRRRYKLKTQEVHDVEQTMPLLNLEGNIENPMKEAILNIGHITNRNPDKQIDLDTQFVKIRLVTGSQYEDMIESDKSLPDRYQDYLQRAGAETIEIEDILKHILYETAGTEGGRKRKPLLMEGRAGVGKSTLVQKLMRLWAQNVWAKDYKAAFLFNIRNLTVLDKRKIPLVELFRRYSIYAMQEAGQMISLAFLKDEAEKILIFIDGMDEFPGLETSLQYLNKLLANGAGEPIEWCVNILRRDVMSESTLIIASRPFKDLRYLDCKPVLEVVGLTRDAVLDFIDHHVKAENIDRVRDSMISNPLVMSVSAITYFCMMFCTVLEEDATVSTEELTTYTRITAFFTKKYMQRSSQNIHSPEEASTTISLAPLTKLAYRGLVDRQQLGDQARLVFDQKDLREAGITDTSRKVYEDCGILVTSKLPASEGQDPDVLQTSEFVHLSIQELLSMVKLLYESQNIVKLVVANMWSSGSFMMAQQYLFGLLYDVKNHHISTLMKAVDENEVLDESTHDLIPLILDKMSKIVEEKSHTHGRLQAIQMVYETQRQDVAQRLAEVLFTESDEIGFHDMLLTVVDINALIFVLSQCSQQYRVRLEGITMDETSVNVLADGLGKCQGLKGISLNGTKLSVDGRKTLLGALSQRKNLLELNLSNIGLDEETEFELLTCLQKLSRTSTDSTVEYMDEDSPEECFGIKSLSLDGSSLSEDAHINLISIIGQMNTLTNFSLANCGLDDSRIVGVVQALICINITSLSLDGNAFTESGLELLAEWLANNTSLKKLSLVNTGVTDDCVEDLASALGTNQTLLFLDIHGEKLSNDSGEKLMEELKTNTCLEALWYSYSDGSTRTVIPVAGTNRRMEVGAPPNGTQFFPWCLQDLITSSALLHPHVVWSERSSNVHLNLEDRYTDLYGAERPAVTTDTWCHTLNQLTSSTHRVGELVVFLSNSASLSPLLSSLTQDMIHTLIHSQVGRVQVLYGEVTCSDLLTWLSSLSSQPGWSVSGHTNGARVTITKGQSMLIMLRQSRVVSSRQQQQQYKAYLMNETRLLYEPEWIKQ